MFPFTSSMSTRIGQWRQVQDNHWKINVTIENEEILTTVTWNKFAVDEWISNVYINLPGYRIVGLDAWFPLHTTNPSAQSSSASVAAASSTGSRELADGKRIPDSLANFLAFNHNLFVGVGIKAKIHNLRRCYGVGRDTRFMDLGRSPALEDASLKLLGQVVMWKDFYIPSPESVSDEWDEDQLTSWQVLYATIKAYVSSLIGYTLYVFDQESHV